MGRQLPKKKKCSLCKLIKTRNEFSRRKQGGLWYLRSACKPCSSKVQSAYFKTSERKDWYLQQRYGITLDVYNDFLFFQGNKCPICMRTFGTVPKNKPHVDHNHKTGHVRGLLCTSCNAILGHADEEPAVLKLAIAYLEGRLEYVGNPDVGSAV